MLRQCVCFKPSYLSPFPSLPFQSILTDKSLLTSLARLLNSEENTMPLPTPNLIIDWVGSMKMQIHRSYRKLEKRTPCPKPPDNTDRETLIWFRQREQQKQKEEKEKEEDGFQYDGSVQVWFCGCCIRTRNAFQKDFAPKRQKKVYAAMLCR